MTHKQTAIEVLLSRIEQDQTTDSRVKGLILAHLPKVEGQFSKGVAYNIDIQALAIAQMLNELNWQGIIQMSVVVEQLGTEAAIEQAMQALELTTSATPPQRKDGQPKTAGGVFLWLTKKDYWAGMKARAKAFKAKQVQGKVVA